MIVSFLAESEAMLTALPKPVMSYKAMPQWLKDMPTSLPGEYRSTTVKRCMPFLDAMTMGYTIPMWCDLVVTIDEENEAVHLANPPNWGGEKLIADHAAYQIESSPFSSWKFGKFPMKLINPWVIQTEPGVSCLIMEPLNQPNPVIRLLSGVVDTDTYYNNINFPFIVVGGSGEHLIKKGTPIAQVIPFVRDEDNHMPAVGTVDLMKRAAVTNKLGTQFRDGYKQHFRHRKAESDE